jgi:hypothetical protein
LATVREGGYAGVAVRSEMLEARNGTDTEQVRSGLYFGAVVPIDRDQLLPTPTR